MGTFSASLGSSWILMRYLLQCSRTGSNLLWEFLCCLLLITGLRLLLWFLVLWPLQTKFLLARTLLSVLNLSSTAAPSWSWLVPASFCTCRWVPGPIRSLLTASNRSRVLTLFLSSLLYEVGLLVLLLILFRCCLLPLLDGILHDVHVLQPHLLYLNDDAGGELL